MLATILLLASLFGGPREVTAATIVVDLSSSSTGDPCDIAAARVHETLFTRGTKRLDVLVLGTGDARTASEPVVLVMWARFEPTPGLFEQPGAADAARARWVEELHSRCRLGVNTPAGSPIFAALRRAVASLAAHCRELDARREHCKAQLLHLASDLRENGDRAIFQHLIAASAGRTARVALPHLDLGAVRIASVCGVSMTRVAPGEPHITADALVTVWSAVLGEALPPLDAGCPSRRAP
jgi:hypothetical protein